MTIWMGMCETPHGTAFVIDQSHKTAQLKLYATWLESVYPGYATEHGVKDFPTLSEWNGAKVLQVQMGQHGIWERMEALKCAS